MSAPDDRTLAVLMRQAEWLLGEVAGNLQADRVPPENLGELAGILDDLAALVRQRAERVVIDTED